MHGIKIDPEIMHWLKTALQDSHDKEKSYHNEIITGLQNQHEKLQARIDAMYDDKLDGRMTQEFHDRKSNLWREEQKMSEKRKILNFVASNSIWKHGRLTPIYRKPFDILAKTNHTYLNRKAVSGNKNDLFDIWLPSIPVPPHVINHSVQDTGYYHRQVKHYKK